MRDALEQFGLFGAQFLASILPVAALVAAAFAAERAMKRWNARVAVAVFLALGAILLALVIPSSRVLNAYSCKGLHGDAFEECRDGVPDE